SKDISNRAVYAARLADVVNGAGSLLSVVEVTAANMEVTTAGYVSTAGEDCRKYSKLLLLLE
ncbi:hypothetical protein Tco_0637618, partial [Tanacetum coccineum]